MILGSSIKPNLWGLGKSGVKSGTRGVDIDKNQYPDVIMAAPSSDSVIILFSRPVIDVTASITFNPVVIDVIKCMKNVSEPCASLEICLTARHRAGDINQPVGK